MHKQQISCNAAAVKRHDPDRFLMTLMMPQSAREDLCNLFAFNYEIAKTRETVSETQLGLIRLQWWREAVQAIYERGNVPEHEVLKGLAQTIQKHDLPQSHFETLIYAREFDLEDMVPSNLEGTLNYADYTSTPLMKLAVQITGGDPDIEPVQPIATNYALAGLLRAVLFHAAQRRCYLPLDLLNAAGISISNFYENRDLEALPSVISSVAGQCVPGIRTDQRFLKLSQALAMMYVRHLAACGFDVFHPKALISPHFKEIRLFLAALA
jgi:phytoene synthase